MAAASALPLSNAELRARLLSSWLTPDQALQSAGLRDRWRLTEAELRELFEAEVEAASSPEQVSLEKQRAISAAGRWRLRVEAGVQRLCAQLQKQDPDSLLPMILRRELLFALSQSAPREGFRAWAARRCTANDWEELRHAGPASGYLDLESFCEMVVLEAGHIDDAKEWFQHLKDLTDGSTCIPYALLRQTAVCCPKLPGAADSAAPWEPTELLPRLLSVWTDLTEAFGWERQELCDVIRDRQQDKLTQTAGPRVSHQQWLYALRGKPEWPLLSETEAQEEAHRLGALGLTADRLFPNLSDRLQVTKNLFLPGELIVVRYTLSDFGHYGVCGPSPMVLGPDLPLGKAPFVAAVPAQPELAGFEEAWSRSALDVSLVRGAVRLRAPGALRGTSAFWHLRIFASDDGRTPTSAVSAPLLIQVMTVPPAPPSEVVAEGRDTSISFKWAECAQNGGAAVDRYDIALRYAESSKLAWTGHAQEPVITATSLTPDCDYTVQVRAANRAGCGPWSPEFAARTAARPPPPQVLAVGRETVLLRLPVEKAGNLTGYVVKAVCCATGEPETSGDSEIVKRSGPQQTEVLLTGLLCATSYRLCAARLNASDQGPRIQVRTKAGTPLPPESLTCLETKQEELCVSWSPPPRDGGAAICGYVLRAVCGPGSKDSVRCKAEKVTASSPAWLRGLAKNTAYSVAVAALSAEGKGCFCKAVEMRTAAARPQPPRQLEVADADAGHLLLRWAPGCDDGGAPVLGYRVQVMPSKPHASLELYKPAGGHGNSDVDVGDADEGTQLLLPPLLAATEYTLRVCSTNCVGDSEGAVLLLKTKPGTPAAPKPPRSRWPAGAGPLRLSWRAPEDGGSPVVEYEVLVAACHNESEILAALHVQHTEVKIAGLRLHHRYIFAVRARNEFGWSARSGWSQCSEHASPPARPDAPRVVRTTSMAVELTWHPPESAAAVLDYEVRWEEEEAATSPEEGAEEQRVRTTQTMTRILGLRPSTRYVCQVRALNSCGWSRWSVRVPCRTDVCRDAAWQDTKDAGAAGEPENKDTLDVSSKPLENIAKAWQFSSAAECMPLPSARPHPVPRLEHDNTSWSVRQRLLKHVLSPARFSHASEVEAEKREDELQLAVA